MPWDSVDYQCALWHAKQLARDAQTKPGNNRALQREKVTLSLWWDTLDSSRRFRVIFSSLLPLRLSPTFSRFARSHSPFFLHLFFIILIIIWFEGAFYCATTSKTFRLTRLFFDRSFRIVHISSLHFKSLLLPPLSSFMFVGINAACVRFTARRALFFYFACVRLSIWAFFFCLFVLFVRNSSRFHLNDLESALPRQ